MCQAVWSSVHKGPLIISTNYLFYHTKLPWQFWFLIFLNIWLQAVVFFEVIVTITNSVIQEQKAHHLKSSSFIICIIITKNSLLIDEATHCTYKPHYRLRGKSSYNNVIKKQSEASAVKHQCWSLVREELGLVMLAPWSRFPVSNHAPNWKCRIFLAFFKTFFVLLPEIIYTLQISKAL